jgi:hypothetical protein
MGDMDFGSQRVSRERRMELLPLEPDKLWGVVS